MKNLLYTLLCFITINQFAFTSEAENQNISKLNNLYLNGVLNKDTYLSSLNKLGLDTNNDIFSNLFDLFENKTIDIKDYEKSILNLISISSTGTNSKNTNQSNNFQFKIDKCVGDITVCGIFKESGLIEVESYENKLKFTENYKAKLKSLPPIVSIQNEDFKLNGTDAKLAMILTHVKGVIFKLEVVGIFENNSFLASKYQATANGKILVNGTLSQN
jgi:hypothetical protein